MILFLKTQVSGYTRRDGTYVAPYEDSRPAGRRAAATAPLARPARIAFALREPVATLTGNELGVDFRGPEDMPALRRAAKEWYDAHLRGTTVTMKDGRVVRFVRKGMGKSTSGNKGDILLRAVPAIKAIVEHGQVVHVESGRKNVEERLIVAARIRLGEETYPLAVSVHRTPDGHYQYDFTFDRSAFALADSGSGKPRVSRGGPAPRRPLPSLEVPHPASGGINLFFWQDAVKASRLEAVTRDLEGRLREVGIADNVALEFRDRIEAVRNGTASPADGRYVHGLIEIALGTGRERRTLDHETIHALRRLGLFRDAEWRTLERRARADTDRMASIRERYGRLGLSEDALVEEAIADMFADWSNGRLEAGGGLMRVAFRRIRAFLEALGNALRGNGFQTAGDVFGRVERGEVGRRHLPRDDLGRFASPGGGARSAPSNTHVAFEPTQSKSAIGNRGTLDASEPSIMKAHPTIQGATRAARPAELNDGEVRRSPGEPSREQAEAGRYNKPRVKWRGLTIAIENPAGSVRRGPGWEQRMRYDYGEIVGSCGVDGDPVDVFVGPNPEAPMVYVVHQRKRGRWAEYDEDKCMVGFDSEEDARAAFLSCYTDPRFLGPITTMPVDEFVEKVRATREKPTMIKAQPVIVLFKAYVSGHTRRLASGKVVQVKPYTDRRTKRAKNSSGQLALFVTPKPARKPPLSEDKARNPEAHTIDMFSGKTRREEEQAALSKVPEHVLAAVRRALERLREIRRAVDDAAAGLDGKIGGGGRYEADALTNRAKDIDAAMKIINEFRRHAPDNGVDAEKVLSELGGLPDLAPSPQAERWLKRDSSAESKR